MTRKRRSSMFALGATLVIACVGTASAYETLEPNEVGFALAPIRFKPSKLPKKELSPVQLEFTGAIGTIEGERPVLKQVVLELDRNAVIDSRGLATCRLGRIEEADTATALKTCKAALVGEGKTEFEVSYPEQSSLIPYGHVLAFNGGVKGGVTKIYLHAFLHAPVSAAVVIPIKASKVHRGRYGTKLVATIPPIADGAGSLTKIALNLFRMFAYKGKKRSYLLARCADGELQAHWEAKFAEVPFLSRGAVVQPCTVKS
jgi:hypothetical protein